MTPHGQKLPPDHLAILLDACAEGRGHDRHAIERASQQFFTRADFAAALCHGLEPARPSSARLGERRWQIADLFGCGAGNLLAAAKDRYGLDCDLYGADIDARASTPARHGAAHFSGAKARLIQADITRLAPLLHEIGWTTTLALCNPPFSLPWRRDRFEHLRQSTHHRIAQTFTALGDADAIDSTLATLLVAIDRLSRDGEGFLITLWSAWERLIRPTQAAEHCWLALKLPAAGDLFEPRVTDHDFAVIYFAADHRTGPATITAPPHASPDTLAALLREQRRRRGGVLPGPDYQSATRAREWHAAATEYRQRHDPAARPEWNLHLDHGQIATFLTPFQSLGGHLPASEVEALHALRHQTPMGLVVQRASREALLRAVRNPLWRVQPALVEAVAQAIAAYHAERAPLYALPAVQRLGYLDEEDSILCTRDFAGGAFRTGERYPIETRIESTTRFATVLNASGQSEEVQRDGRELVLELRGQPGARGQSLSPDLPISLSPLPHVFILGGQHHYERASDTPRDRLHTFADLIDHFDIPEIPDIAALRPEEYQANLEALAAIEAGIAERLAAAA